MAIDETFDFGLDPDESFDPWEEDDFELDEPHIMTVLGPIAPGELPPANAHATVAMLRDPASQSWVRSPEHQAHALKEIDEAFAVGIGGLVDLNGPQGNYDSQLLFEIASNAPVQIIAATGPRSWVQPNESAILMALDGRDGIDRGPVRAGLISVSVNDPQLINAFDAAAISGLPIVIDVEHLGLRGALKRIEHWKQPVEGVIFSGIDPNAESAQEAALEASAFLLFDGLSGNRERDGAQGNAIVRLVQAGHGASLLLGYNPHYREQWLSYGGAPGWPYLIEQFPLLLLDRGLRALDVKAILVDNPNRAFVIERPTASDFFE